MKDGVLVAALFEEGRGTGHIVRSARLVQDLRALGMTAFLRVTGNRASEAAKFAPLDVMTPPADFEPAIVVTDLFRTAQSVLSDFEKYAVVLGLDEGGTARAHFDFLLDILHYDERVPPNERRPSFAAQSAQEAEKRVAPRGDGDGGDCRVLITFGGEDRAGLGQKACAALQKATGLQVTLLTERNRIENLRAHLGEYDLVITHYGLTAYECLAAGVPVALSHPTRLHERLAHYAGFPDFDIVKKNSNIKRCIKEEIAPICEKAAEKAGFLAPASPPPSLSPSSLPDYISNLAPLVHERCPLCAHTPAPRRAKVIGRFPSRTYRACPKCGMVFMDRLTAPPVEYAEDYFFDFYKKQYGKTYIEDFPNLKAMAARRLSNITAILGDSGSVSVKGAKLLELGSAYGPFLLTAHEAGFDALGQDPAESAVRYVKDTLGLKAVRGFFPQDAPAEWEGAVSVVAAWFVVEHIFDVRPALQKAAALLQKGGVFAFSTPALSGISALKSRKAFLENSPADHWTLWDARRVKKQLSFFGFSVKKIVVTGHHPERFPPFVKLPAKVKLFLSRLFWLGDTFEVYATKI